jgi:MFS superfamily sulfate permease-like transporter
MRLRNFWSADFPSSIVVFLVALPLCLGIALASDAPLFSGLLAGIIGGIVVGSLSGSPLSVSGPAAGLTSIVAAAIFDLGSYEAFLVAVVMAGVLQILMGYAKAGSIGHFFPASVIKGMLAGIGLILILKQIPHAIGYDVDFEGDESFIQKDGQNTFTEILEAFNYVTPGAIVIASVSIILLMIWDTNMLKRFKFFRMVPAPLGVVFVGVMLNIFFNKAAPFLVIDEKHLVSIPVLSDTNGFSSLFIFPDFSQWLNPKVYYTALTLAIVASLETLLSIEACDKLDPYKRITPLNRELKAQGVANFVSGILGGLPVTSVIVRSSTNINSGAQTKASAISHGVILLLTFFLIPNVLQMIPLSCLAGILIMVGYKLTNPALYKNMYSKGLSQFLPFITTVLAVTFTNLLQGVIMGIVVAIFFILKTNYSDAVIMVNRENNYLLTLSRSVSFLNKANLRSKLQKIPNNSQVVIDGSQSQFIDSDIRETIEDFIKEGTSKNIQVDLKQIAI